ncbi:P-loop containing nucleoside triphosphate hydrolase protein [Echria macrotheca]|uniref:P-loop containing nucleoside triphosphate hydrolase protein n=1 Tax=Echria macrotheca TaxID=438768 RepID=A0AAJ0B730_9PEZI|nr:P-loop containing nucleoside triphosphate hydrolase protein [Echria macrotheca]
MPLESSVSSVTDQDEDFSVIERLADAIRIEDDARIGAEDRLRLVQDLYEGPRKCQCCVNWIPEIPPFVDLNPAVAEEPSHPLIVRRRVMRGEGKAQVNIESIEICNPDVRKVLFKVFDGYDGIIPEVKYLILRAPFRQFFWRWEAFENAIDDEQNEVVKAVLIQLRSIVRAELAEAFAVTKELVSHGIITYKYLWTIFPPGEIIYDRYDDSLAGRFFSVISMSVPPPQYTAASYQLTSISVDWNGHDFRYQYDTRMLMSFRGTRKISALNVVPAKYVKDGDRVRALCIERGRKFYANAGLHYKAYVDDDDEESDNDDAPKKRFERRIVLDSSGDAGSSRDNLGHFLRPLKDMKQSTYLISQAPVDATPPGGHRPLQTEEENARNNWNGGPPGWGPPGPRRAPPGRYPPPGPPPHVVEVQSPSPPPMRSARRRRPSFHSVESTNSDSDSDSGDECELTEEQLLICNSKMHGYCLREKDWYSFDVDRIRDIEWNTKPFDSLVLPDGYKDLILSFVESQLKEGDSFDDVINGKGGGLVILLAGDPGVGKTMTAESVAEKIHVPLVKMELSELPEATTVTTCESCEPGGGTKKKARSDLDDELTKAFEQAARWKAVLLIDECDIYLERRKDDNPQRNYLVSRFLRELEYYPSLLFLTTNRERVLDPAIYSRIHLTINYPALDVASRLAIWKTFLGREESSVTEEELHKLADIDVNGRRIKNITKTARIMARRGERPITFPDIRNVMRITEGLTI